MVIITSYQVINQQRAQGCILFFLAVFNILVDNGKCWNLNEDISVKGVGLDHPLGAWLINT